MRRGKKKTKNEERLLKQIITEGIREKYNILDSYFIKSKLFHIKTCKICGKKFTANRVDAGVCSFTCKMERMRQASSGRKNMIKNFKIKTFTIKTNEIKDLESCVICKFNETIDWHHYGKENKEIMPLCPNHHYLFHRHKIKLNII